MSELLTTKQLQELLKIDRITVYRMLNDGRLKGVKIGNQWRFPQGEIDRLTGEEPHTPIPDVGAEALSDFPSDCVSKVQNIYAGIIGIGAVTVSLQGETLTEPAFCNPFCKLMLSNPSGRKACQSSWRKIALQTTGTPSIQTCHAGLSYQRAIIQMDERPAAWLIGGQFYLGAPDPNQENERLVQLAEKHDIPIAALREAADRIPILKKYQQEQVVEWTPKVALTITSILCERSDLMNRLQRIADLSHIRPTLSK